MYRIQNDIPCHHRRSRFSVILNRAAGGVKDLKLRTASLLRLSSQVLHSFLQLTQGGGVDDPKTIIGERSVVAGRALTERGRPRPRERLPKERSSKGWMKRSGTLAEPSDNYTAAFINGSSTTIRGISSLPGSVASRLVIFLVTILAFRISIKVSHE